MLPGVADMLVRELLPQSREVELQGTGETLLYPGFDRILDAAAASGARINLITNGTLLTCRRLEQLASVGCHLVVSFDGANADSYEWHRRGARFDQVVANLSRWREVREDARSKGQEPSLTANMTLTAKNLTESGQAVSLFAGLEFDAVFFSVVRPSTIDAAVWESIRTDPHEDRVRAALAEAKTEAERCGITFGSSWHEQAKANEPGVCPAPWEHVYVAWNGDVFPCCQFRTSLGNCLERPFDEIWKGRAFAELRRAAVDGSMPPECAECVLPWANNRAMAVRMQMGSPRPV
jgi:radical SAM protein with 4Fe4S-binding SPASM domain